MRDRRKLRITLPTEKKPPASAREQPSDVTLLGEMCRASQRLSKTLRDLPFVSVSEYRTELRIALSACTEIATGAAKLLGEEDTPK